MKKLILALLAAFPVLSQAQQLVMPGDHPDPSVVKIGDGYWASATSSNWMPAFPILYSKDLIHWEQKGHIFETIPAWADFYFWAPEFTYDNGYIYVYYAAHKRGGNLCVAVARASKPEGPYEDLGPLVCESDGSIDAFPMRDEKGELYLIWKEDGNSIKQPTPIWAQRMAEDRKSLLGTKKELFRNDQGWEKNLVEGVSMIRQNDYFYAFYAAAGCCGAGCNYVTGVARSKSLMGPWEKDPKGPLMTKLEGWNCPGHGTPVIKDNKFYFLYHGYDANSTVFTGREGLLQEFSFTSDGWISMMPSEPIARTSWNYSDKFNGRLEQGWQWSIFSANPAKIENGQLVLASTGVPAGGYLGRPSMSGSYTITAKLKRKDNAGLPGVGALGDDKNALFIETNGDSVSVISVKQGQRTTLAANVTGGKKIWLRMQALPQGQFQFFYSENGRNFRQLGTAVSGRFLPPWDRAVRAGLLSGSATHEARFEEVEIRP